MRRLSSLVALAASAVLLVMACSQSEPLTAPTNFAEAKAQATQTGKPVLIDFFATW